MKARKTMKNQALIQEVISQISQRFAPKIPDIKKVGPPTLAAEYNCKANHRVCIPGYRDPSGEGIHRAGGRFQRHFRLRCLNSIGCLYLVICPADQSSPTHYLPHLYLVVHRIPTTTVHMYTIDTLLRIIAIRMSHSMLCVFCRVYEQNM